jgi:hypothetical protein
MTTKKSPRTLAVHGEEGLHDGRCIGAIDEKRMKRQAATIGRIIDRNAHGYAVTKADVKDLEGVWAFLHGILDEFREIA